VLPSSSGFLFGRRALEAGWEQGGAVLAAAASVAGLHRVERARITAAADGTGCGQDWRRRRKVYSKLTQ